MLIQIHDPLSDDLPAKLRQAIEEAIPGAKVDVRPASPKHFEISVISAEFDGLTRVRQHQRVYAAIGEFMRGDDAPVHAIDRLETHVR